MRKLAVTMSAALLVLGSMALSANAQTQSAGPASVHALKNATPANYPGGLSGLWPLLSTGICPNLLPVPLLVPPCY
jgi:hypothetical protein